MKPLFCRALKKSNIEINNNHPYKAGQIIKEILKGNSRVHHISLPREFLNHKKLKSTYIYYPKFGWDMTIPYRICEQIFLSLSPFQQAKPIARECSQSSITCMTLCLEACPLLPNHSIKFSIFTSNLFWAFGYLIYCQKWPVHLEIYGF